MMKVLMIHYNQGTLYVCTYITKENNFIDVNRFDYD